MAKQTGLEKFSGTMGGVRHFKIKDLSGDFAGMVGGPSGDQILTAPEFERTRRHEWLLLWGSRRLLIIKPVCWLSYRRLKQNR